MINLSENEHDALIEVFNIGVGRAAAAMSGIVNEEVVMSVPRITFETRGDAARMLSDDPARRICGISQHYSGAFNTEAILMFPEDKSFEIVRLMVGDAVSMEELSELEQEAMSEIGNIILNSCMGMLANLFDRELQGTMPVYRVGTSEDILVRGAPAHRREDSVLMLRIDFHIVKHEIQGYVAFLLDLAALMDLQLFLARYIARFAS
jgi:chemotaxis protein CheC